MKRFHRVKGRKGWFRESKRHSLARRGFKTVKQQKAFFGLVAKAKRIERRRPRQAQVVDESRRARTVLPFSGANLEVWRTRKSRIDIAGIDVGKLVLRLRRIHKDKKQKKIELVKVTKKLVETKIKVRTRKRRRAYPAIHKLTGVETEQLRKLADERGIARDLVDWQALIDSSLTYSENKQILTEFLQQLSAKKSLEKDLTKLAGEEKDYVSELEWRTRNAASEEERAQARMQLEIYGTL